MVENLYRSFRYSFFYSMRVFFREFYSLLPSVINSTILFFRYRFRSRFWHRNRFLASPRTNTIPNDTSYHIYHGSIRIDRFLNYLHERFDITLGIFLYNDFVPGLIRETMIEVLQTLRENDYVFLATMPVFILDPSIDWRNAARKLFPQADTENNQG